MFSCCFIFCFQIAAKIGGDGVAAPPTNEFGYGGQKRPLEDAGGYFPMPNLNIGQWLKSISMQVFLVNACLCVSFLAAAEMHLFCFNVHNPVILFFLIVFFLSV